MKSYNADFLRTCAQASRSPRAYVIIKNDEHDIYLTSHSDIGLIISAPDVLIENVISGITTASESVTPEDGISVLGGGSITLLAQEFTDELRDLFFNSQETIYNNKVEIYIGDENLAFDKYQLVQTLYVRGISNGNVSYTISLQTAAFLTSVEIFKKAKTRVFTAFTSADKFTNITVNSTTGFEMIQHDATWTDAPSQTVGYLKLIGSDANGKDVVEYMRYTGKTLTTFTGITRNVLGTGLVTASGSLDGDSATEVEEVVHLDLPIGKSLIALLTGQLYGQVGQTLPDGWHCGLSSSDIDIASFENMGLDLWNPADDTGFRLWLDNPNSGDAKQLISRQILRLGLVLITNQYGQLACKRFGQVINTTAAQVFLTNDDIKNKPTFDRQSSEIRNSFVLQWGYRSITEEYSRTEVLIDGESQQRNNYISKPESIQLDWVRNYRLEANQIVKGLLDGMRSRKASPPIKPSITCDLVNTAALELMDVVGLYMETFPDHTDAGDVNRAFEIQQIQTDWMNGVTTMRLYGASDKLYPLTKDGSIPVIDHTGWTLITDDLTGSFTDSGGILTLTSGNILTANGVDGGVKKYYYDGVFDLNGQTLVLAGDSVIDCSGVYAEGATINGIGYGASGGAGGIAADGDGANTVGSIPPEAGSIGFVGGNDLPMDGVYHYFPTGKPRVSTRLINATRAPYLNKSAPNLNIVVDADGVLQGLPDKLSGSGGTGGLWFKSYGQTSGVTTKLSGGAGGNGAAGLTVIANFFSYDFTTEINLSGEDGEYVGFNWSGDDEYYSGSGSGGSGAAFYCYIKDVNQSLPNNADGLFVSRNGVTPWKAADLDAPESGYVDSYMTASGSVDWPSGQYNRWPYVDQAMSNATSGQDFSNSRFVTGYLVSEAPAKIITGVDAEQKIPAPTLTLTERFNTPNNGLGNYSTIVATVSGITDPNYSYTRFFIEKFDGSGKSSVEMGYALPNSNSAAVEADGSTYRIFAIPVSKTNLDGEFASQTITVKNYLTEPATEQAYALPPLKGLRLKNSIAANNFNEFKSGNAEFYWKSGSANNAVEFAQEGLLGASSGSRDPYFKDYLVRVLASNGKILREESVNAPSYIYTLDKNKYDNAGRSFTVSVYARGQNNQLGVGQSVAVNNPQPIAPVVTNVIYASDGVTIEYDPAVSDIDYVGIKVDNKIYTGSTITLPPMTTRSEILTLTSVDQFGDGLSTNLTITNPIPNAPSGLSATVTYNTIKVDFIAPTNDYDYKGVNMRFKKVVGGTFSAALLITATSCVVSVPETGTEYEIELTSVDSIGAGGSTSILATTVAVDPQNISGLSNWATETDPADLAFINANIDNDAIASDKITSLVAGKITAGQIDVAVDIGTGVRLDGASGTVQTANAGYVAIMGVTDESWNPFPQPLIMAAYSGIDDKSVFAVDLDGNVQFGSGSNSVTFTGTAIEFGSDVTIGSNADQTYTVYGGGADFANFDDALEYLSKTVPAYKNGGFTANLVFTSGTTITTQHHFKGIDLSWITITGTNITIDGTTFTDISAGGNLFAAFIRGTSGAKLPNFNVDMTAINGADGFLVEEGSIVNIGNIDLIDFGKTLASIGAHSYINADTANIEDSQYPLVAVGGKIDFNNATTDNCQDVFNIYDGGQITASNTTSNATANKLIIAYSGAEFYATNYTITNTGFGGSHLIFSNGANITIADSDLRMLGVSPATKKHGFLFNSIVKMTNTNFLSGAGSDRGIISVDDSFLVVRESSNMDLQETVGSIIMATDATNSIYATTPITGGVVYQ